MYLLIIFLPLLNFFSVFFFKKFLNKENLLFLCCVNIFISLILTVFGFYEVVYLKNTCYCYLLNWINFNLVYLDWFFFFDFLSITMCFIILLISFLVHLYSIEYMFFDPLIIKFMSYLSLFTFFMLFLVSSGNLIQLFFGWEGVGLSSYLLINFWHTRTLANKSAIKAIIVNRISDFALYFGLFIVFYLFKSFDIPILFILSKTLINFPLLMFNDFFFLLNLICFFFFIGAMGKSAQFGLHTWLPDAMEGPTPVSALIHAATMVTAGIFLLIRFSFFFIYSPTVLLIMLWIGGLTTFFAGSIGCFQHDIKKIIAYSTCSQLGYMTIACGNLNYNIALFHLFNHAFFKALLFLGAGSIIHIFFDEQDIRKYGNLYKLLPITYLSFVIASFAIAGLPFLTGFYSKDLILEIELYSVLYLLSINLHFFWFLSLFSIFFTVFYSFRIIYYSFFGHTNFILSVYLVKESSLFVLLSLIILSLFSLFIGFFIKDLFIGPGLDNFVNSIFISYYSDILFNVEFLSLFYKLYPIFISFFSCFNFIVVIALFNNNFNLVNLKFFDAWTYKFYRFFNQKWFFDIFYKFILIFPILNWSYFVTFKLIDRGFLEFFGSFTLINFSWFISKKINLWSLGLIYHYIFIFFINIFFFLFFYLLFIFRFLLSFEFFSFFFSIYHCFSLIFFIFILLFSKNLERNKVILFFFVFTIFFFYGLREFFKNFIKLRSINRKLEDASKKMECASNVSSDIDNKEIGSPVRRDYDPDFQEELYYYHLVKDERAFIKDPHYLITVENNDEVVDGEYLDPIDEETYLFRNDSWFIRTDYNGVGKFYFVKVSKTDKVYVFLSDRGAKRFPAVSKHNKKKNYTYLRYRTRFSDVFKV